MTDKVVTVDQQLAEAKFALLDVISQLREMDECTAEDLLRWRSDLFDLLAILADAKFVLGGQFEAAR